MRRKKQPEAPPDVLAATPEHLQHLLRRCRCGKWFAPLCGDRPSCLPCVRQNSQDALIARLAYGKEYQ